MTELRSERVRVSDSLDAINKLYYGRGWTDGLPIIPPTVERVTAMLSAVDRDPQEVIGIVPPKRGEATIEKVAVNAVMAGCLPEYLPVVIAALEAMIEKEFNLYGIQATTNPAGPLLIVNGPIVTELDINYGYNVLGQGWRANATIGRAVRLVLLNVGGGAPGILDRSTHGQPGKYSFCIAENEAENPWESLNVERGFDRDTSTVTVLGASGTLNIADLASSCAESLLKMIVNSVGIVGNNNMLLGGGPLFVLCPEHASLLERGGFSKRDVKAYIYENSRVPLNRFSPENVELLKKERSKAYADADDDTMVTIADSAGDILIVVAGGAGAHTVFVPTFGNTRVVTKPVLVSPKS